ncbi:MAG TPA: GNAT family N-acetyltransferase [Pyrinomonadaceae bacterium]|jgi:GNAT superfamily N-acetyltransferase|nr:GNAT family N-acetyltransferase [Pyrinomonadaceae bacterium]
MMMEKFGNEESPDKPEVRFASVSDAPALAVLRYDLRASTGRATEPRTDFMQRCTSWMEIRLHETERWRCWVAEEKGGLIGAVWVQLIEKIPNPRFETEQHGYLTNFYVAKPARGQGLGSRLLREAIKWCESRGVHAIILWPTDRSRSLYQRHGFAVREDIMELILNRPEQ